MKKLAGDATQMIDLGGRTVIPGLTDGHIHGVRAALTFGTEINWIGVPTLKEALDKIRQAGEQEARLLDRGGRRLDRGTIRREAAADTEGDRRRPRPTIPSISSISTTGPCCRQRRWKRCSIRSDATSTPGEAGTR